MPDVASLNKLIVFSNQTAPNVLAVDMHKQLHQLAVEARHRKNPVSDPAFFARPTGKFAGLSSTASFVDDVLQGIDRDDSREGGVIFALMRLGLKQVQLPVISVISIEQLRKIARVG